VIPGLVLEPPKATPEEKQKRKKLAAKAAKAAKSTLAAQAPNITEGAKIVLMIKGPPKSTGAIPKTKVLNNTKTEDVKVWTWVQP
jgi:hypothetical protein